MGSHQHQVAFFKNLFVIFFSPLPRSYVTFDVLLHYREEEDEDKLDFRLTTIDVTSHSDAENVGPDVIVNLTFDDYGKLIGKYT